MLRSGALIYDIARTAHIRHDIVIVSLKVSHLRIIR